MTAFTFTAPHSTVFGRGTRAEAAERVAALGHRVLLVRGRAVDWVDMLHDALIGQGCAVESVVSTGEPDLDSVRRGVNAARTHSADCVVGVGGGAELFPPAEHLLLQGLTLLLREVSAVSETIGLQFEGLPIDVSVLVPVDEVKVVV